MFSSFYTRLSPWDLFIIPTAHYWWQHIPRCLFSEIQTNARVSLLALNASTVLQITGHKLSLVSVFQCQVCLRRCLPVFSPAIASPQHCHKPSTRIHCFAWKLLQLDARHSPPVNHNCKCFTLTGDSLLLQIPDIFKHLSCNISQPSTCVATLELTACCSRLNCRQWTVWPVVAPLTTVTPPQAPPQAQTHYFEKPIQNSRLVPLHNYHWPV